MNPKNLAQELNSKRFRRAFRGYQPREVDHLLAEMLDRYRTLYNTKSELEAKLSAFQEQEDILRGALIRAEEVASESRRKALAEADAIRERAQEEVARIQKALEEKVLLLEEETETYRQKVHQRFFGYEREARLLLDRFYMLVRRHVDALDQEISGEVQKLLRRLDTEIDSIPKPSPEVLAEVAVMGKEKEAEENPPAAEDDKWREKEESLLVGYLLQSDLCDESGQLVVPKSTVVTPDLIANLIERGLYGELVAAIESSRDKGIS